MCDTHDKESLSIILPIYNEEKNIRNTVTKIIRVTGCFISDFELILVNDGSTDMSAGIMQSLAAEYPSVRIITGNKNRGYGFAVRTGILNARKDWLLIMDADGQYEINDLIDFWNIKSSYDFIAGFRKKRSDNPIRRLLAQCGNRIANLFFKTKVRIKDVDCGFKLFKTSQLKSLPLLSNGILISFEVIDKSLKNKCSFNQLPVRHYKRISGKSTCGKLSALTQIYAEFIKLCLIKIS